MRKAWKKDAGVSPVIATILMVAITVVLAAVLYVMVMGFGRPPTDFGAGQWKEVTAMSRTSGKVVFGAFTGAPTPLNLKLFVRANGTDAGFITWGSNTDPAQIKWTNAPSGASVAYYDYNPGGGQINSGDYLTLSGLRPGTTYAFEAYSTTSDSVVSMTGAPGQLTTPS